jgi:uncharacterized protein YkwD
MYSASELETMKLINDYSKHWSKFLRKNNYVSVQSEDYDKYKINNNVVNHDGFVDRPEIIIKTQGAKTVGENIAYNYSITQAAVNAWLNSPGHKENIAGNYTHFELSIRDAITGKKCYTTFFAEI